MLNLAILAEQSAKRYPENKAVTASGVTRNYAEFHERICKAANAISAKGVGHGDKVAMMCPNIAEFPVIFFAILKTGAAVVPLSIFLKTEEIAYQLRDSEARMFFCYEGSPQMPTAEYGRAAFSEAEACKSFITVSEACGGEFGEFIKDRRPSFESFCTSPEDTAVIIYTSGTTGKPKGAELSHANLFTNAEVCTSILQSVELETVLVVLPLFHIFGLTVMFLAGIRKSLHLVLMPKFDAGAALLQMREHKVAIFGGVPTMYWSLLQERLSAEHPEIISGLRICLSGGASLSVKIIEEFESRFGVPILEGYGMSEGSPVVTFNQIETGRKAGSIGTPVWGVDVKIVNEDGAELPDGEKGELVYRGPNVMKGYYKKPEATRETLRDGWLYSGDVAYRDAEGFYFLVDRKKDIIIRGGMNVYPREVEDVLLKNPTVEMAAVMGFPDEKFGEEITAFIVLKKDSAAYENEIINWAKAKMASYKYPRKIKFVESLPTNASGKILKNALKNL